MTKTKKALITGITGQDGSYLAEFLLKKMRGVVLGRILMLLIGACQF